MNQHWSEQQERSNRFMLSLLCWTALTLGRPFVRLLLYPIVAYFMVTGKQARRASELYLNKVLPQTPSWRNVFRHFYTFAQVSIDRLFFLSNRFNEFEVEVEGKELVEQYLSDEQGCLLLVSHLGSFDMLRASGIRNDDLPIRILMDKQHNAKSMQLIDALDPELAKGILDAGASAPALVLTLNEHLQQGELIGIMADRAAPGERVVKTEFLNAPATFPAGPWMLGLTLQVPVILCVGLYDSRNRYRVYFELMADRRSVSRQQRETVVADMVGHYASRLEYYARLAPYNWFNFYNFWLDETTSDN